MKPLIVLEFNELCEPLLDKWIDEGKLPNFKKLKESAKRYTTVADAQPPALEPWIQWYSMHTGLPYSEHGVFSLTEGQKQEHVDIWEELQTAGFSTLNCGSMNCKDGSSPGSIYIPDPWCTKNSPFPESLKPYHDFVSDQVQNQTSRKGAKNKLSLALSFVWFMIKNGLSFKTINKISRQLINEQKSAEKHYWKRAFILDWIQADLFIKLFKTNKPKYSTFFLNSTAHTQHSFWKYLEPEKFNVDTTSEDYLNGKNAILKAYQNMDELIARFFSVLGDEVNIALATALSQQAFLKDGEYQVYYRMHDVNQFLEKLGFNEFEVSPVMTHQYIFKCDNKESYDRFQSILDSTVFSNGDKVFDYIVKDDGSLYFGTYITREVGDTESIHVEGVAVDFQSLLYRINESKSGCHHPEGVLWIQSPEKGKVDSLLPIVEVNQVIKNYFEVA